MASFIQPLATRTFRAFAGSLILSILFVLSAERTFAQSLQLIATVPGTIFDTDGQRVLYLFNNGVTSNLVIRDLATGSETNLSSVPNQVPQYGFLGPRDNPSAAPQGGAIFVTEGQDVTFNTLNLVTSSNFSFNLGKLNSLESLRVAGNYAVWNGVDINCSSSIGFPTLYRTDLRDGSTLALAGPCSSNGMSIGNWQNDVTNDGSVVAWTSPGTPPYNIVRFDGLIFHFITNLTGNIYSIYPRTDGQSYLYIREQACCNTQFSRLILNRGAVETILRDGNGAQRPNPGDDYQINSGWIAFRDLDGSIPLISPAGAAGVVTNQSARIIYVAQDGSVAFIRAGTLYISNGDVIAGTHNIVPIGNYSAAYKTASVWYFHDTGNIYKLDLTGTTTVSIIAAILPNARTAAVRTTVTAFATIINTGNSTAAGCFIALPANIPASFLYQTTNSQNAPVGRPNAPVGISPGASQGFYFAITPTAVFSQDIRVLFQCANSAPAPSVPGLNTIVVTAQASQPPDLLAIAATATNDGIMNIPGVMGTGFFATAAINIGTAGDVTFSATDTAYGQPARHLPIVNTLCQTDPSSGQCLATPTGSVTINVAHNQTVTFTIFSTAQGTAIPFDPANTRIFFTADQGATRVGQASVAARTP